MSGCSNTASSSLWPVILRRMRRPSRVRSRGKCARWCLNCFDKTHLAIYLEANANAAEVFLAAFCSASSLRISESFF